MKTAIEFDIELVVKFSNHVKISNLVDKLPIGYSFDDESDPLMTIVRVYKDKFLSDDLTEEMLKFIQPLSDFFTEEHCINSVMRIGIFDRNYISHINVTNIKELALLVTDLDITIYPTS